MKTTKGRGERYQELLERYEVSELRSKLEDLERCLQFGEPGSQEPSILQEELEKVRSRGERDRSRTGTPRPELLVLSVGTSPEPLLLATAYHSPVELLERIEAARTAPTVEGGA